MPFNLDTIHQIAHLAQLSENTRDGDSIQDDLNQIVKMVDQINACNTDGIQPLAHPLDILEEIPQRLREDKVTELNECSILLALAPKVEANLFLVPTVIE